MGCAPQKAMNSILSVNVFILNFVTNSFNVVKKLVGLRMIILCDNVIRKH
jgi:hypothetical protein